MKSDERTRNPRLFRQDSGHEILPDMKNIREISFSSLGKFDSLPKIVRLRHPRVRPHAKV